MAIISLKQEANIFRMALVGLTVLLIWGEVRQVEAGCQRFGHSCFGAHGKRGEIPSGPGVEISSEGFTSYNRPSADYEQAPLNYNRISPYLLDWIMSMHRGEMKQLPQLQREDLETQRK